MHWFKAELLATAVVWALTAASTPDSLEYDIPADIDTGFAVNTAPVSLPDHLRLPEFWRFASRLSRKAEIYYPDTEGFRNYSQRWSNLEKPIVNITVLPATERDVIETVRFANKVKLPFLAYNGRHGSITTLGRMDEGIAINLRKLNSVKIAPNGQTARVGGGINSKVLIDRLWAAGKQAVTGTCECVSYLGPALGGGHGWLQGRYGLIADQFVSMNIVLADGSLKTINQNWDLWWAMKGAGHNFGIVTSVQIKIFPRVHTTWAIETLMFTGDKVAALYQAANDHLLKNGTQPIDLINWSYWFNLPPVDPAGPVVEFYIIQEGVNVVNPNYTAPFHALGPISITPSSGSYLDVSRWVGIALDGPPCQKVGAANPRFPLYLSQYNATAMAELYDAFAAATNASSPFSNSLFMFEGYSNQGVQAVNPASTAFAWRNDHLLTAPLIQYTPGSAALDQQAAAVGNQLRDILHRGSGRSQKNTYVNYAYGDETTREWYGHEQWRQDRLRALKRKYDPRGSFSFYAPAA